MQEISFKQYQIPGEFEKVVDDAFDFASGLVTQLYAVAVSDDEQPVPTLLEFKSKEFKEITLDRFPSMAILIANAREEGVTFHAEAIVNQFRAIKSLDDRDQVEAAIFNELGRTGSSVREWALLLRQLNTPTSRVMSKPFLY